jgi:2',3'-cyclic-nucleotide 2'-phosphodiesterase/3'-nucleotidase
MNMAQADVTLYKEKRRGGHRKVIKGKILKVSDYKPDAEFMEKFKENHETILAYVDEVIGNSSRSVSSRDSYFGPSGFVDMIHSLQLEMTGADISFAAPLSFDVEISKGPVTISDMFKLYRFENMLYTMRLSGEEILKYLEFSYSGWYNTMKSPDDLLLKFRIDKKGKIVLNDGQAWLRNPAYNFDSAAGIEYTVDVSKPEGSRVDIKKFTNGTPFDRNRSYNVAVNSYRGNGGGGHLTEGAGLTRDEMLARVITSTDRDLRYYMIESIKKKKNIDPEPLNNWKLIPEKLVKAEAAREYKMLFGNKK